MLSSFAADAEHIYLACGSTDFRKQIDSLVALVTMHFKLDPFSPASVFIFCNKTRSSIKVLRYDKNGFVLATKKLLQDMKFQWPKDSSDIKDISEKQLDWLLSGLSIDQKKALKDVDISSQKACY